MRTHLEGEKVLLIYINFLRTGSIEIFTREGRRTSNAARATAFPKPDPALHYVYGRRLAETSISTSALVEDESVDKHRITPTKARARKPTNHHVMNKTRSGGT
jgi:hypothetical protein